MRKFLRRIRKNSLFRLVYAYAYLLIFIRISIILFSIEKQQNENIATLFDSIWLSVISITTVEYGDTIPITIYGRIVVILLILSGIFLTALLTGSLTSLYINRISKERSGRMKLTSLKRTS